MEKTYLIVNINCSNNTIYLQVNKRDTDGICYNLTFVKHNTYLVCDGFMIPTFTGNYNLPITGNSDTRAMVHCLKVLPKIQENKTDIIGFIAELVKKEKLNHYQLNINGNMDYSNAKPVDLTTLSAILQATTSMSFPIEF